jgi:chemotaxis receptor (MCP) glutamine deamidase CheD
MNRHLSRHTSIHIGGVFASREPAVVRTVLGSCVAACLYDPQTGIGGMNHFMLPSGGAEAGSADASRYGVHAMELLINRIMTLGGDRRRLRAKAFGGADLLGFNGIKVGTKNAAFVREFLSTEGIPITAQRLGGQDPLAVYFITETAKALVRPLTRSAINHVVRDEQRFAEQSAHHAEPAGDDDVTLF